MKLYVLTYQKADSQRLYYDLIGGWTKDFGKANFYHTKNPATSARNKVLKYYSYKGYKPEELVVLPVEVIEPA